MSARRVLVTGVNGFVGQHAVRELATHGYEVVGMSREPNPCEGLPLTSYLPADLTQAWPPVAGVDAVLHLAGLAAVGPSFDDPQTYIEVNSAIINRMASWAKTQGRHLRAVVVSSGAVYDSTHTGQIDESAPTAFTSPYVVSKVLVENLVAYYRRRGFDWLVARPFNHIGPGQGSGFLLPDLAAQLMEHRTSGAAVRVGDLSTARDYTDVRDVVRAYRLLLEAQFSGDWLFNICSGRARTGTEILAVAAKSLDIAAPLTEIDQAKIRPDDPREIRGSFSRLEALTGWHPDIEFMTSVNDFVSHSVAAKDAVG